MASDEKKAESGGGEAVAKDGIEEAEKEIVSKNKSEKGESVELAKEIDEEKVEEDAKMEEEEKVNELGKDTEKQAVTPRERPARERKAVDRYWVPSPASRSSAGKPISIEKGSGTPLRDIPNVAFKLSKRKPDDNLQLLHTILFGKKAKVHTLKRDIGQFSGFVWTENEEKQRAKMKEKLDKCVKEKLLHFCDVLNIPINKSSVKKEDLTVKLLEFLESPHATTEELLADKDQKGKSQKRKATSKKSSSSKTESAEKLDKKTQSGDNETDNKDDNMESQSHSSEEKDDAVKNQESDEETESEEEKDESKEKTTTPKSSSKDNSESEGGKKSTTTKKCSPDKSTKISAKSEKKTVVKTKKSADAKASASSSKAKGSTTKKQKVEETKKEKPIPAEDEPANKKRKRKPASKEKGKEETKKETKNEPTNEDLRAQAVNILKEVDFNTATLSDILRLLGSHFGLDLMHRKAEVRAIITDVIESMSNSDDDEEDEDDSDDDAPGSVKK